jgi:hypothetical protein
VTLHILDPIANRNVSGSYVGIHRAVRERMVAGLSTRNYRRAVESVVEGYGTVVYELRIYHVVPGKMENLVTRLRDHTMKLFADHGIKSVAYWTALDEPMKSSTSSKFWSIRAGKWRQRTGRPSRTIRSGRACDFYVMR